MNVKKIIMGAVFLLIGIIAINVALSRPCEIGPITQTVQDQEVIVEQPEQMNRMVCLSTDPRALIIMLIGTASVFPGIGGIFKGITEDKIEIGKSDD